jgi:DNA mismatch repair protein MutL
MSIIRILPETLSNKIAAGEVVERPASVVKELLENSLDAESTQVLIEIEKGGRSLIRVSDNGAGMSPDDALLCIERYATSKIYKNEDLFDIRTLGFRGEALPSIASVAKFSLVTRQRNQETGTQIHIMGGKIQQVTEIGAPIGTEVVVRQLFFNTPARRKFLKGIQTEMGHIVDVVSSMALGKPKVHFKLIHNKKLLKNWVTVSDPVDRVIQVLGSDLKSGLIHIQHNDGYLQLNGWISLPAITRKTSRGLHLYINGRSCRDRVIQHAIFDGYAGRLVKGQVPMAVIFIQVPFDQVDVNVHPSKNEVRFSQQKRVHAAVRLAVSNALNQSDTRRWNQPFPQEAMHYIAERPNQYETPQSEPSQNEPTHIDSAAIRPAPSDKHGQQLFNRPKHPSTPEPDSHDDQKKALKANIDEKGSAHQNDEMGRLDRKQEQGKIWKSTRFQDLKVIGQYQDIYIICESRQDLIVIDQHAAHERILYEKLRGYADKQLESQGLLLPETIELNFREARVLESMLAQLSDLGFEIEPFGGQTFVIKSMPALLDSRDIKTLLTEIVEKKLENQSDSMAEEVLDDCIKLMACHGAIRANQRLNAMQINAILSQLDRCENPSNCPHGRPTWVKLSKGYFEKAFKRILT